MSTIEYAELHAHSYYSLLDGASAPEALVAHGHELGLSALALTDHDSLTGAVRFWTAAQRTGLHAVIGAEVTLADETHLTLLAETQTGYANLCRLLTTARMGQMVQEVVSDDKLDHDATWAGKVAPRLAWDDLHRHHAGLIALSGCRQGPVAAPLIHNDVATAQAALHQLLDIFGPHQLYVELQHHALPDTGLLLSQLVALASQVGVPVVATNNVHYATPAGGRLRDCLLAIAHNQSLCEAQRMNRLPLNHSYYLTSPVEMAQRFRHLPEALYNSVEIARRCHVSLDFSQQRLPHFPTPLGLSEFEYLYRLCHDRLRNRYPAVTPAVVSQMAHELTIIEEAGLSGYFLILWDIVREAQARGILYQGRGSAANSLVAYALGITPVDPLAHDLLFARFLSADKYTTPDVDIDFQADRREEIIRYVYDTYGADHVGMVCNVVTYRARSAVRDLGKALGFPADVIDRLAKSLDVYAPSAAADQILAQIEPDAAAGHPLRLLADLLRQIDGVPRHLSIHSGGMVITAQPLSEVVPLEPATMPGRVVCQWDKDSLEDAGLIKIDVLGLRSLGVVAEALSHIREQSGVDVDLDALPLDDPAIYAMLQKADTIGTFQVESRAQLQMAPRLKPQCFADIAVQVAIVRPGPIQAGAVHPYLKRRAGQESIRYLHPSLEPVLRETLGVLLFQEQAIKVAMVAANFAPGEADMLRRALSRSRPDEAMAAMRTRFMQGAAANGIEEPVAAAIFAQLAGFAGYGFCKSHACSFARIAYITLWLKRYHPAAFYCAILNAQPMGFYSPEVIIGDARRHGVHLLPPDLHRSQWEYTLEQTANGKLALRTGLRAITGLGVQSWERLYMARQQQPFADVADFVQRTRLPKETIVILIRAGVLDSFGERRDLLWQLGQIHFMPDGLDLPPVLMKTELPDLPELERVVWEYELMGLSPGVQVMQLYRPQLRRAGILSTWEVKGMTAGKRVLVAGMVVVRQRPQTAKGITFISLEDEAGLLDLVVKPNVYQRLRPVLRREVLIVAVGLVQRQGRVVSVLVGDARSVRE